MFANGKFVLICSNLSIKHVVIVFLKMYVIPSSKENNCWFVWPYVRLLCAVYMVNVILISQCSSELSSLGGNLGTVFLLFLNK